jgi:Replication-relaxation
MSGKVTERDVAVLVDIYKYRYLSVSQIEALHFPSRPVAWRRLRSLITLGFVKDFTAPGISERIFFLDNSGAEIVAAQMQVEMDELKWHRSQKAPKDYYFLRHFLAINDFRITLTHACQTSELTLLGFIPEYVGEKTKQGNVKKYLRDNVCDITDTLIKSPIHRMGDLHQAKTVKAHCSLSKLIGALR